MKFIPIFFLFLFANTLYSQTDVLITKDNTELKGEIKEMQKGVLTFKTSYSDSDFKIEWLEIKSIYSTNSFLIQLSEGKRLFGTITVDTISKKVLIIDEEIGGVIVVPEDIVYIKHIKHGHILDIINLSLDFGYTYTKANELNQLNSSMKGDYYTKIWGMGIDYNTVQNIQKNVDPTKRTTAGLGFKLFLKDDYFCALESEFYNNKEHNMDLQSSYNLSIGKYFIHTNRIYFNTLVGVAYTYENFSDTLADRKSVEGKMTIEYNMFDIGDFNLFTNIAMLPSFTEKGRYRVNLNIQIKYDLPRDFYIKTGIDFKYDRKPIDGALKEDYVFTAGFGWEL